MVNRSWLLTALVGMVLIFEATALKCITCKDTDADLSCSLVTSQTPVDCTEATDVCYMRNNAGKIERGCLKDLPVLDQPDCVAEEGQACMTCSADSCNNAPWAKCQKCAETDTTCATEKVLTDATFCSKYVKEEQCYAKVNGDASKVTRGCKSDLSATDDSCTGNKFCEVCSGDGCNSQSGTTLFTFPKCLVCKSTEENCVTATLSSVECDKRDDTCFTRVQANVLERGCLSTLTAADQGKCKTDNDATCLHCTGKDGCNDQKWLQCHQCKETATATCTEAQTDDKAQFCKSHKEGNQCYELLESNKVVRGCESDLAENPCKDNQECRKCATNACNKEAGSTLLNSDRCPQCSTSTDPDGNCLLGKTETHPCIKQSEKKCYTKTDADGVLHRGCQGDLTADEIKACTGKTCEICEADKCSKIFPEGRLRCYQCNSTSDKTCVNELSGEPMSSYCQVYKADDQCYSRIADNTFGRGCQSDLKAEACKGLDAKQCKSCATANCNNVSEEKLKNSAGQKAVSSILIATVVAFVVFK